LLKVTMNFWQRLQIIWKAPCGPREVLVVALPLMISHSAWAVNWFIDRMFLLVYSPDAIAAAFPAGMMHWTLVCLPHGVVGFVNTFIAQYAGANRPQRMGPIVWQGIFLGLLTTVVFLLLFPIAPYFFLWGEHPPELLQLEVDYFRALNLGAGGAVIVAAQSAFFSGREKTLTVMSVMLLGTGLNLFLDYVLIFGKFGFPEWGITGAGLATAASHWCEVVIFGILMLREDRAQYGLTEWPRMDRALLGRLFYFGGGSSLPQFVENAAFTALTIFINGLGAGAGAATALAFNVNAVAFAPMIGLGTAASVLVGQQLGANKEELAVRGVRWTLAIGLLYSGFFGLLYVGVPDWFLLAHDAFVREEDFVGLRDTVIVLLRFVAAYCLFDAAQIIFTGALRGAGDTWFILGTASIVGTVFVVLGRFLQLNYQTGLFGWWWIITGWIAVLGLVYCLRFRGGKWKSMRVIEPREE
jgi:MATE family multidrug resistance protein